MSKEVEVQTPKKVAGLVGPDEKVKTPIGDIKIRFLQVNPSSLGLDMQDQAAIYGWISSAWIVAKTDVANLEQEIREREASLWGVLRSRREEGIKLTVKDMEQEVESDPVIQQLKRKLIEANSSMDALRVVRDALDQRASMIQSLVGLERSKMDLQLQADRAALGEKLSASKEEK